MTAPYNEAGAREALVTLPEDYHRLVETQMTNAAEYLKAVEKFHATVLNGVRFHRNWNEDMKWLNKPETAYHYDEECGIELPAGWKPPVPQEEIEVFEYETSILYLNISRADLLTPSLASIYELNVMDRTVQNFIGNFSLMMF